MCLCVRKGVNSINQKFIFVRFFYTELDSSKEGQKFPQAKLFRTGKCDIVLIDFASV